MDSNRNSSSLKASVQLSGISQAFVNQQAACENLTQDHRIGPECNGRIRRAAGHPPVGRFVEGPLRVLLRVAPCFWIPPSAFPQQTAATSDKGLTAISGAALLIKRR